MECEGYVVSIQSSQVHRKGRIKASSRDGIYKGTHLISQREGKGREGKGIYERRTKAEDAKE